MLRSSLAVALTLSVSLICGFAAADEGLPADQAQVDFVRDIQPIFAARCYACHGQDAQEGQLRLDAKAVVTKGGVSGPLFQAGEGQQSLLFERVVGDEQGDRMPLDDEPLTDEQIALIRRWIDQGAVWPEGVGAAVAVDQHWAYHPVERPQLPATHSAPWVRTPIDAFVLARLQQEGLTPSAPADKAVLLRRVYLDLIGLPPGVAELDAFLADTSPRAYEAVVDRLLASPHYGQRWARPWLDAARYADSNGYQADQYRNVWPYRDWVIQAMNADMPFDEFTVAQMAGDLLPGASYEQKIATGFHRLTTCNVEAGVDPEENRVNQIIDRVNTTGTVWLGTTIECAQCHNHKYDPFTQRDYYQVFAYFNNTPLEVEGDGVTFNFVGPKMDLPLAPAQQAEREELLARLEQAEADYERLVAERRQALPQWERELAAARQDPPRWHVLDIASFASSGGASHELLDDKSVLVGGKKPDKDLYTITVHTDLQGITGFQLETLMDPSLPGNGPGRHDAARPNFVLYEFQVAAAGQPAGSQTPAAVHLHSATADFSQARWDVAGAIDGDPETGWAINPQFGKPHQATFLTGQAIGSQQGTTLTFTLDQHYGGGRAIGRLRLSALTGTPTAETVPDEIAKILERPAERRSAKQSKQLEEYFAGLDPRIKQLQQQVAAIQKQIDAIQPTTTLVMVESDEPRMTAVFNRGNFLDQGEPVRPGTPAALSPAPAEADDRLDLASWLVDRQNPLTARVAVNRWWAEMFGRGIVETIEDFGTQGEPPTHPELLDWLAVELMESGWSMKRVHKLIVMSAVYQQSSSVTPRLLKRDPYNKWYARASRFRLPAETIRDNALAIAGLLASDMGGPPVFPPQPDGIWRHVGRNAPKYDTSQGNDRFRRGIYVIWRRSAPYPSFINFDAPDRASCVVQRPRTNTPLQALTLLNDPAYVEMALALAGRLVARAELDPGERVRYAIRLCLAREPRPEEVDHLAEVYRQQRAQFDESPGRARELIGNGFEDTENPAELAAWFCVANILLNLDEAITRG